MNLEVMVSMKYMQQPRIRFSLLTLILLTAFSAWFIRARVSPMLLAIKVNPDGSFEHGGKALPAVAVGSLLQKYQAKQKWCLSRSILRIVAPVNLARTRSVGDAMDYVALSACSMKFDQVRNEWYTASTSTASDADPDPQLLELLQKIRTP